jgi:hypothetical protein
VAAAGAGAFLLSPLVIWTFRHGWHEPAPQ